MVDYEAKVAYRSREVAESYDEVRFTSPQGKYLDRLEKNSVRQLLAQTDQQGLVLDLASGSGRFAKVALDAGNYVVASDISAELLKVSKQRLEKQDDMKGFVLSDAERLPFRDDSFDCVIAIRFIGMLPEKTSQTVLKEIWRVTRKWAILNFPNAASVIVVMKVLNKLRRYKPAYYGTSPGVLCRKLSNSGWQIAGQRTPLLIPPGRLPKIFLGVIKPINWLGEHSFLGQFSEQRFLLLRKIGSKDISGGK